MKVLILGFNQEDEQLLATEMEKLIIDSQCFLFTLLCGGRSSVGFKWAEKNGCPVEFVDNQTLPPIKDVDFALVKIDNDTSAAVRNYIMQLKAAGKHGRVIK